MNDIRKKDDLQDIMDSVCRPVTPAADFQDKLYLTLMSANEIGGVIMSDNRPLWKQTRFKVLILLAIIVAIIIYGFILPGTLDLSFFS